MSAFPQPPSLEDLRRYSVNRTGQAEAIKQTLYDTQTYDGTNGQSQLTFFQSPVGANGRTYDKTNMPSAGALPTPISFLITGIEVHFIPTGAIVDVDAAAAADNTYINDVQDFYQAPAFLELNVGSKNYLREMSLYRFPPSTHLNVQAAISFGATASAISGYADAAGKPYNLVPPILLVTNQNFDVSLRWPTLNPLPSTNDGEVTVVLNGLLYRESQ